MNTYHCKYCQNEYKLKVNYERHVGFCEFKSKSIREMNNELDSAFEKTPTMKQLFGFMKELVIRVDKLEKENEKLKQYAYHEKRKIDILHWLSSHCNPSVPFHNWITSFPFEKHLQTIFDSNLYNAIIKCFEESFHKDIIENLPIIAFSNKINTIYIYDKVIENSVITYKWYIMNDSLLNKWLQYIEKQFIIEFKKWCDEHPEFIDSSHENDHKFQIYISNYQKILGGNMSTETRNHRIKQYLYNKLKKNIRVMDIEMFEKTT